jgi:hypothetical protein
MVEIHHQATHEQEMIEEIAQAVRQREKQGQRGWK